MRNLFTFLFTFSMLYVQGQSIRLVKDFTTGSAGSTINFIRSSGEKILFRLNTASGWDLMISDGTSAGTQALESFKSNDELIKSFEQGSKVTIFMSNGTHVLGYEIDPLQNIATQICNIQLDEYFDEIVYMKGSYYIKAGFYLVKLNIPANTYTVVASLGQLYGLSVYKDEMYTLEGGFSNGFSLYKSDGTQGGTVKLKKLANNFVSGSKNPNFKEVNGKLVFTVYNSQKTGEDGLWVTDGTASGTEHIKDLYKYDSFDFERSSIVNGNKLFFSAKQADVGYGWLYVTDGTRAGTLKIDQSEDGLLPVSMTLLEDDVYFHSVVKQRIYTSDGTITTEAYNFPSISTQYGDGASLGFQLTTFNEKLYSFGWTELNGGELWECGTGANDFKQYDFIPGQDGMVAGQLTAAGDKYMFFVGNTEATGEELYVFDPGTVKTNRYKAIDIKVSPNPAQKYLQLPENIQAGSIEIIDFSGKSLLSAEIKENLIDIYALPSGPYILKITDNQKTYISKFIKL